MASGFSVTESISANPAKVWACLTDFKNANRWMPGIDDFAPADGGRIENGARLTFRSRGKQRESQITAFELDRKLALTSTQGGVTATYAYSLAPKGEGTQVTLDADCQATGLWKLLHPVIVIAMKKADSPQLKNLKKVIEAGQPSHRPADQIHHTSD